MILSAQFWPTFREEKLKLPEVLQRALDKYTKAYEMLKGNRTLCWKNHLGMNTSSSSIVITLSARFSCSIENGYHGQYWNLDICKSVNIGGI